MTTISTHVLDLAGGVPASGMKVHLAYSAGDRWETLAETMTDADGRVAGIGPVQPGTFRLGFETGEWGNDMYPFVHVVFTVEPGRDHYHVPLLLSPYGYSTYRGS